MKFNILKVSFLLGIFAVLYDSANAAMGMLSGSGDIEISNNITITGKVTLLDVPLDSGRVYWHFQANNKIDSTTIHKGQFIIKDTLHEAGIVWISFSAAPGKAKALFLEPGDVRYQGDVSNPSEGVLTGSELQLTFEAWNKAWMAIHLEAGKYYEMLNKATKRGKIEASDSIRRYVDAGFLQLGRKTDSTVLALIRRHPSSPVSAYVVVSRYVDYPNEIMLDSCIHILDQNAMSSVYGRIIARHYSDYLKTAIGATPKLSMPDATRKMVKLSDFKGKYLFVDFWASWCAPCRRENPNIVKAYNAFHKLGFEILGVSLDENKNSWLAAVKKDDLNWVQVSDLKGWKSPHVQTFGIKSIPFNFLLDSEGKVVARNLRGEELAKTLNELFGGSQEK